MKKYPDERRKHEAYCHCGRRGIYAGRMNDMLCKAGYKVDMVNSFENVTEQLLSLSPDLILLDLNLPCGQWLSDLQEIKQKSAIPVLVLTSRDQMKDELHALKLGADEYLTNRAEKNACLPGWQCSQTL